MKNLSTTIATYQDQVAAEKDWAAVESAARVGSIDLADAVLVKRGPDGTVTTVHRQSHHGWGKGAVAGGSLDCFPAAARWRRCCGRCRRRCHSSANSQPRPGRHKRLGRGYGLG